MASVEWLEWTTFVWDEYIEVLVGVTRDPAMPSHCTIAVAK